MLMLVNQFIELASHLEHFSHKRAQKIFEHEYLLK